jgi:ElaB/YqjD/DUF883 family membrane-anchored ribosome-binding protein
MGQESDEIREEIVETRARMGETVEAIGYKADVKSRAGDWVSEKKDALVGTVSERTPDRQSVKERAGRGVTMAKENPLGLAVGGAAVGFLAGLLVPSTRVEDEKLGDVSDELKERARETGQEALERGKEVAQEAGHTAMETAREQGQEHTQEMASSLKENAQDVAKGSGGSTYP